MKRYAIPPFVKAMIVKTKSHKRAAFKQVLNYMVHNKDRLYDEHKRSFAITHNLKGKSIEKWVKQYEENDTHRKVKRKDNVKLTHEILSWHKGDAKHLTLDKLEAMARKYIELRNPKGMYVAVPHFDKDHCHVHILASGIEYKTGKSMWMYKSDFQKLKTDIQRYQEVRFPELSKSIVAHNDKSKPSLETEAEYQLKRRTGRQTEKEKLSAMLKTCYKIADSRARFFHLLSECGLKTYERGGKVYGVVNEDKKYRFNTLGYNEERLQFLDRYLKREEEMADARQNDVRAKILQNQKYNENITKEEIHDISVKAGNDETESTRQQELNVMRNDAKEDEQELAR